MAALAVVEREVDDLVDDLPDEVPVRELRLGLGEQPLGGGRLDGGHPAAVTSSPLRSRRASESEIRSTAAERFSRLFA